MDLKRTFPEDKFFRDESNLKKMKNILICYSVRNSPIGYCQGFNFIVAQLLKVFEEEVKYIIKEGKSFLGIYTNFRRNPTS